MNPFVILAVVMAVIHVAAFLHRPLVPVFVSAALWGAYAYYERLIATGVLCDANCNIRVDLVLFFPVLAAATAYAYSAYHRPPGRHTITGYVLSAVGLVIVALLSVMTGYMAPAAVAGAGALALAAYAVKLEISAKRG